MTPRYRYRSLGATNSFEYAPTISFARRAHRPPQPVLELHRSRRIKLSCCLQRRSSGCSPLGDSRPAMPHDQRQDSGPLRSVLYSCDIATFPHLRPMRVLYVMPRGLARTCIVGARARVTSRLQQGSTRCEIGGLVERDAFSQYVPRWARKPCRRGCTGRLGGDGRPGAVQYQGEGARSDPLRAARPVCRVSQRHSHAMQPGARNVS